MKIKRALGPFKKTQQYLATMVMLFLLAAPFPFIVNCGTSDYEEMANAYQEWLFQHVWFGVEKSTNGAESVQVGLALQSLWNEPTADVAWTPPGGATRFEFSGAQPSNPNGPLPFAFLDVPTPSEMPDEPTIELNYRLPAVGGNYTFIDTALTTNSAGTLEGFCLSHQNGSKGSLTKTLFQFVTDQQGNRQDSFNAWRFNKWLYDSTGGQDLGLSETEALVTYLQSGAFFVGLRFAVPQEANVLSYRLPLKMSPGDGPVFAILDHGLPYEDNSLDQAVAQFHLEYLPERNEWLQNHLPAQSATRWAALAPNRDPIILPEDRFPVDAGLWEFFTTGVITMPDMPADGEGCTLELYMCHVGTEPPPFFESDYKVASTLLQTYQDDGVTCFGPWPHLVGSSSPDLDQPIKLHGQGIDRVAPPARAQFHHMLTASDSETITISVESSRGFPWRVYEGSYNEPDLGRPITGNITVSGGFTLWLVGDIPADAPDGADTIVLTASLAAEPDKKVWATDVLWVGDWTPPEDERSPIWIPVASHAGGAQGSAWRTDLGLLNLGTVSVEATVTLHSTQGPVTLNQAVPAGAQLILSDVVDQMSFSGAGALEITASAQLIVTSRTYSQVGPGAECFPNGTLGQSLAGTSSDAGLTAGQSAVVPQLQENDAYRTNVAVINTGTTDAQVVVHLFDADGTELTSYEVPLTPSQWKQKNQPFADIAGQTDMAVGYARIEVLSGSGILAYGSVVDNLTNDPTTMAMVGADDSASTVWVPVASHSSGAQGSSWRTDLGLLNTSAVSVDVMVLLHVSQGPVSLNRTVPGGAQLILTDVVEQMGFSGAGALEIIASLPLVVTSRTYSQVGAGADCFPEGTLGQSLAASLSDAGIATGQSAVVPQLQENAAYRTNVAVINTGTTDAQVVIHLFDGAGTELGTYDVSLTPGQWKQKNRPFADIAGQTDMAVGYARIEVLSGSGILAYGSVVDNLTNDPTTMAMVQ